eukprot:363790-Chlamydomonas_euryale.AAC.17
MGMGCEQGLLESRRRRRDAELESIDAKLSDTVRWLNERKRRHDFYAGFAHAPVDFINSLVASMVRCVGMCCWAFRSTKWMPQHGRS